MARRIAFLNYKGGVGKTSLIVNIAACLVEQGKRVLLCDLDTQSNASIWLLRLERWNSLVSATRSTIFSLFLPDPPSLSELIISDVVEDKDGRKVLPGLDLLPTSFNLVDLEADFVGDPRKPAYVRFWEELAKVEANYDFILFDCPPNVLRASQCGVFSATDIYVPANPDALSLIGFTLLIEKLSSFQDSSAGFRRQIMGPAAQVQGILFNAVKSNTDVEVPKMRMQLRLNQFKTSRRVARGAKIFNAQVRDATIVRRAVTLGLPVPLVSAESVADAAGIVGDYRAMARELFEHTPLI
ncbi:MAG: chromosome partitioning protein [Verrucomicrobia bacterium]|nr:MAG: chromosome partitioning protein [Verrucomicrobiota bacterium]